MKTSTQSVSPRGALAACLAAAALVGATACAPPVAGRGVTTNIPRSARIQGPHAPAGARFAVQLDQAIDTAESLRRGTFTARLVEPLVGAGGQVIAQAGATVRGTIRSLGSGDSPRIRLRFETVDTAYGPAPLPARMRDAQYREYPGEVRMRPVSVPAAGWSWGGGPGYGYNTGLGYGGGFGYGSGFGYGGGFYDGYWSYVPYQPTEVHLPAGARLELQLTEPLVPPGSTVLRR